MVSLGHISATRSRDECLAVILNFPTSHSILDLRISSLASIDPRLSAALRAIREHAFSYVAGTTSLTPSLLSTLSQELGHPTSWGDPSLVPAYGGPKATEAWRALGASGRGGVGGIPCEIVHGKMRGLGAVGGSCTRNVAVRTTYAFVEALALYTPVFVSIHHSQAFIYTYLISAPGPYHSYPSHSSLPPPPPPPSLHPPNRHTPLLNLPLHLRRIHLGLRLLHAHARPRSSPALDIARLVGRPVRVCDDGLLDVREQYLDREWEEEGGDGIVCFAEGGEGLFVERMVEGREECEGCGTVRNALTYPPCFLTQRIGLD